jgi:hypothetical protein
MIMNVKIDTILVQRDSQQILRSQRLMKLDSTLNWYISIPDLRVGVLMIVFARKKSLNIIKAQIIV